MSDLWWNLTFDVNFHFKHLKLHISGVFSTGATGAIAPVILRKRLIAPVILRKRLIVPPILHLPYSVIILLFQHSEKTSYFCNHLDF